MTEEPSPSESLDALLMDYDEMLSVDDLARILRLSRAAVKARLEADDDRIPSYQIGKSIRIHKSEFKNWMLRHRKN